MSIDNPEESLNIIYSQLSKSEIFKGYRPADLFVIGVISGIFAIVQPLVSLPGSYFLQWMILGGLIAAYVFGRIVLTAFSLSTGYEKQQVKTILLQFFPSLLTGLILFILLGDNPGAAPFLPGIFCFVFGLGLTAMIPNLTKILIFVVLIYFTGGIFLLGFSDSSPVVLYRLFGAVFMMGHLSSAWILRWYINEE